MFNFFNSGHAAIYFYPFIIPFIMISIMILLSDVIQCLDLDQQRQDFDFNFDISETTIRCESNHSKSIFDDFKCAMQH